MNLFLLSLCFFACVFPWPVLCLIPSREAEAGSAEEQPAKE